MATRDDHAESGSRIGAMTDDLYQLYLRVMRRVGHYHWFSLLMKHAGSRVDRALIRASRGRLSLGGPHMPTMLLTTRGRRSGKERTVPLFFVRDGKNLVAVCENFGLEATSSWPRNLLADPKARIEINGATTNYLARPATEEEVAHNMPRLNQMWPAHDTYLQRSGTRHVIVFEPVDAET
ncbi:MULTISPECIES: nitroreductase/quinone reductase family protein [Mycobacterium]|uniref:nitroreductase/quinone reductase family protein n=1 Tax=Mycobacterium TaxID=1763 RepID=UPI00197C44B4|nr:MULTISPECIES: nitroreductase/quinone reductase family protein [Mycobacterium]MDM4139299.1 nitroreductase/quinone reductase family protein [Mycobacterium sp. FLAC0960]